MDVGFVAVSTAELVGCGTGEIVVPDLGDFVEEGHAECFGEVSEVWASSCTEAAIYEGRYSNLSQEGCTD